MTVHFKTSLTRLLFAPAVVCTCLLLVCTGAYAQEAAVSKPLSLQDCINIALKSQLDIIVAKNDVAIAKNNLSQTKSNYLPQISLDNNAFTTGDQGVLSQYTTGTALSANLNVFDGGVREANVKAYRYNVVGADSAYKRTIQTVTYSVTEAYYEALRSKHLSDVQDSNVKYYNELLAQVTAQIEQGAKADVDRYPVEAELASAKVSLLSAQNTVRTSILDLQTSMGIRSSSGFDVAEVESIPETTVQPLDNYVTYAKNNRPDITQAQAQIGSTKATATAKRISLYPIPTISAGYQKSVSGGYRSSGSQMVGGITFNLFDGGASRAAYKAARLSQESAIEDANQLDRDVCTQVEEAYLNLTSAKERLTASEASLESASKNLKAQQDRYTLGLGITLDVLNAESQHVSAQSDYVQAKYDYLLAISQLEYMTGKQGGIL
ncbi:TolC family protein [bacterium]|nr:TolC family protein [bacterium]